jgi:hypothetical protein
MGKSVVFWVVVVVAVVVLVMWSVLRASVKMKSGHISSMGNHCITMMLLSTTGTAYHSQK